MSQNPPDDVVEHLQKIVREIMEGDFYDPLRVFESISTRIRTKSNMPSHSPDLILQVKKPFRDLKLISAQPDFDILETFAFIDILGLGLKDIEGFGVASNMTNLRASEPGFAFEFWGKITTLGPEDYYIAQGSNGDPSETKYFVTCGIQGPWILLEKPSDMQMKIARYTRYLFSGDLSTPVPTHPEFNGCEMHFLSAIVRHISSACSISASNIEGTEPADELIPSIHCYPEISLGRFMHSQKGPLDKRERKRWLIRYEGDPNTYIGDAKEGESVSHGFTVIESVAWPGFAFVISGYLKLAYRIYIGNGMGAHVRDNFLLPYPQDLQENYPKERNTEFVVHKSAPLESPEASAPTIPTQ